MPSKTSLDNLASFIRQLHAETLTSVLIELAADHATVHERLVRLQLSNQPKALATVFRKKLAAWKRSTKYVDYSQVSEFGRELQAWLEQVEHELMPRDPPEALALAEAFIQGDEVFFNRSWESFTWFRENGSALGCQPLHELLGQRSDQALAIPLPRLGCGDERTGVRSGNHAGIGNHAGLLQQWLVC